VVEHQLVPLAFELLGLYVDVAELVNFVEIVFRVDLLVDQGGLESVQIDQMALLVGDFDQVALV
jgi:hypothetical protein